MRASVPKVLGRSAAARSKNRTSGAVVHLTALELRVFRPRTKSTKQARVHGRNARTLMRIDRGILGVERHLRVVHARVDLPLRIRHRYARHARHRGVAVNDLLVGVLVHHRETKFWRFPVANFGTSQIACPASFALGALRRPGCGV